MTLAKPLRRIARLLAAVLIGVAIGTPLATERVLHVRQRTPPQPEAATALAAATSSTWESVQVAAQDGVHNLDAWLFTPPEPQGSAVLLLHGVGDTRAGLLDHATFLLQRGFIVLIPDSRGHGSSGGDLITYGVREASDVRCWTNWLLGKPRIQRLYGIGQSMGAAILLQALPKEPRFRAVVADCPFSTFEEVSYYRLHHISRLPEWMFWPIVRFGFLYTQLRYGVDLRQASPIDALRASSVPVLLLHGTADVNIPFRHSEQVHSMNPHTTTLWLVQGADHFNLLASNPAAYSHAILDWFDSHPYLI